MADVSQIKLPDGNTYNIKDAVARQMTFSSDYTETSLGSNVGDLELIFAAAPNADNQEYQEQKMGQVLITESNLQNIADAIRTKSGTTTKYTPANMASAISAIPGGAFNWMGDGVECLNANLYNATVQLADTTFSTWTASTTAK